MGTKSILLFLVTRFSRIHVIPSVDEMLKRSPYLRISNPGKPPKQNKIVITIATLSCSFESHESAHCLPSSGFHRLRGLLRRRASACHTLRTRSARDALRTRRAPHATCCARDALRTRSTRDALRVRRSPHALPTQRAPHALRTRRACPPPLPPCPGGPTPCRGPSPRPPSGQRCSR